jgi:hypothetical protein
MLKGIFLQLKNNKMDKKNIQKHINKEEDENIKKLMIETHKKLHLENIFLKEILISSLERNKISKSIKKNYLKLYEIKYKDKI